MLRFSVCVMFLSSIVCFTLISAGPLAQETAASSSFNALAKRSTSEDGSVNAEPIVCGENEEYSKCSNGGCSKRNCSEVGRPGYCIDFPESACVPGCICKHEHLRDASGNCVPIKECPKKEICSKPNEYYDPCPPSCPRRDCRYDDSETSCPPQPEEEDSCYPTCRCKEGFYKKISGLDDDCVPYEDCSKFCFGKNEYFDAYPKSCEPQLCDTADDTTVLQSANTTCNSGCRCHPGFVRNKYGECIAKETCGKCLGPHEYFGCNSSCDDVCPTVSKTDQTECTTNNGSCVEKCYCDPGYARDANNICIPMPDCPQEK